MSGSALQDGLPFGIIAGAVLPEGAATNSRASNVRGCQAIATSATAWTITLENPIDQSQIIPSVAITADAAASPPKEVIIAPLGTASRQWSLTVINVLGVATRDLEIRLMFFALPKLG